MGGIRSFPFSVLAVILAIVAATLSGYALWEAKTSKADWTEMDKDIGILQRRTDAIETHLLNSEMTNFLHITNARLALNLNRQFIFYGQVSQAPLTHEAAVSLYTNHDFFGGEDQQLKDFIINLVKQHTKTVLQTVKATSDITKTRVDSVTINYLDNTNPKNLLAQYKAKKLRIKINNAFVPVSLKE